MQFIISKAFNKFMLRALNSETRDSHDIFCITQLSLTPQKNGVQCQLKENATKWCKKSH